jgi:DNA-binding winged helix-turn-helix (wHTH) protein
MSNALRFFHFGPFRMDLLDHRLLREDEEVVLTPKAFDTLVVLVRNSGRIVTKRDLLKDVWPETFVTEATVAQNIFTLRKALGGNEGDPYIQTIPKRGYRFVAGVTQVSDGSANVSGDQLEPVADGIRWGETLIRSVAVLPLINTTNDPNAEYLCDSLTESLVNSLSLFPALQIKACTVVLHYKGRDVNVQDAGRDLGVAAVLVGRAQQFYEKTIIRMELVDVENGWQVWGEEYKEKTSDMHKLQETVTKDVSEKIRLKLNGEQQHQLFRPHAQSAQA